MKKLQVLTLSIILSSSFITQATLVNGFSDIHATMPQTVAKKIQASVDRIKEEIGDPVTIQQLTTFLTTTQNYIDNLKNNQNPTYAQLQIAAKAVIDLIRASKNINSNDILSKINAVKVKALDLKNMNQNLKNIINNFTE